MEKYAAQDVVSHGVLTDPSLDAIPNGGWSVAHNAHIFANKFVKVGGSSNLGNEPSYSHPGHIQYYPDPITRIWIQAGNGNVPGNQFNPTDVTNWLIWSYDGAITTFSSAFSDKTPDSIDINTLISEEWNWTSLLFNGMSVFNHQQLFPMYLADTLVSTKFVCLPWDDTQSWQQKGNTCKSIAQFKNFLFAIGMTESGVSYPYNVRWSNIADSNSVPNTWDEIDLAAVAGNVPLPAEGGLAMCGLPLHDSLLVYSQNAIHAFDFVGGQYVFNVRVVSNVIGVISNNAAVNHNGMHYFIGLDNIYMTDGNNVIPITHDKIRKQFIQRQNPNMLDNAFAFTSEIMNEVWFCISASGSLYPNFAFIFDVTNQSWSTADIPSNYSMATGRPAVRSKDWLSTTYTWANDPDIWASAANTSGIEEVYLGYLYGQTGFLDQLRKFGMYGCFQETPVGLTLSSGLILPAGNPDLICTVTELTFNIKVDAQANVRIYTKDTVDGPEKDSTVFLSIYPDARRVQFRLTGRYFGVEFISNQSLDLSLSAYELKYVVDGQR